MTLPLLASSGPGRPGICHEGTTDEARLNEGLVDQSRSNERKSDGIRFNDERHDQRHQQQNPQGEEAGASKGYEHRKAQGRAARDERPNVAELGVTDLPGQIISHPTTNPYREPLRRPTVEKDGEADGTGRTADANTGARGRAASEGGERNNVARGRRASEQGGNHRGALHGGLSVCAYPVEPLRVIGH